MVKSGFMPGNNIVIDKDYHIQRKTKKAVKYRLKRRSHEVIWSIREHYPNNPSRIIDLGTADGLMLSMIRAVYPNARCVGIEYQLPLIRANEDHEITILQADANYLPVSDSFFDVVIATAVIEYLPNPMKMLNETKRILKPNGIIIISCPDPFWVRIAEMVRHLPNERLYNIMNIKELVAILRKTGYIIVNQKKFMLSPIGMPFETQIEYLVRSIGLDLLFANQLVVGRKKS